MPLKDLARSGLRRVKDVPVVDGVFRHQAEVLVAEPLPEQDVLVHGGRLESLALLEVEDLQRPLLGLERDDELTPVHDGTVGLDGSTDDIVVVLEIDDDDLGLGFIADPLTHTDEPVRFECL